MKIVFVCCATMVRLIMCYIVARSIMSRFYGKAGECSTYKREILCHTSITAQIAGLVGFRGLLKQSSD